MKARTYSISAFLLCTSLIGTLHAGVSIFYSLGEPERRWQAQKLRTCWTEDASYLRYQSKALSKIDTQFYPTTQETRTAVKKLINESYSSSLTGIQLEGFGPCPTDPTALTNYPYRLASGKLGMGLMGVSSLGDENFERPKGYSLLDVREFLSGFGIGDVPKAEARKNFSTSIFNFILIHDQVETSVLSFLIHTRTSIYPRILPASEAARIQRIKGDLEEDIKKFTILHEVGHGFGLLHEQTRSDTREIHQDGKRFRFCTTNPRDLASEQQLAAFDEVSRLGTQYDLFSVMNYCQSDMIALFHKARLTCDWKEYFQSNENLSSDIRGKFDLFFEKCEFVRTKTFPVGLTPTDKVGLRKMYLGLNPTPTDEVDFKKSKEKQEWIDTFTRFYDLNL